MKQLIMFAGMLCGIFALNCVSEEVSQTVAAPPKFCDRYFRTGPSYTILDANRVRIVNLACSELGSAGDRDAVVAHIVDTNLKRVNEDGLWSILDNCPATRSVNPTWTLREAAANCLVEVALENTERVEQLLAEVQYREQLCKDDPKSVGCLEIKRHCSNHFDPICVQLERKGVIR